MIGSDASPSLGKSPQDTGMIKRVSLNTVWLNAARLGRQILQLVLSALFVGLLLLFSPLLPEQGPQFAAAVKLFSLALFPLAIYTISSAILRGMEFMQPYM